MTTVGIWVVVLVVTMVIVATVVIARSVVRRRVAPRASLPPLIFPLRPQTPSKALAADAIALAREMPHRNGAAHANGVVSANGAPRAPSTPSANTVAPGAEPLVPRAVADRSGPRPPRVLPPPGDEYRNGETVRFYRPIEQALQLLPGHLEVLAGTTREREIRFVRVPGGPPHVVLGRDPGPSPNAIGLGSATVSRRHARMDYIDGRWHVKNLSHTNPLVVNDDLLVDSGPGRPLADGDRLELGEVVLRFHEH